MKPAFAQELNSGDTWLLLCLNGWHNSVVGTVLYLADSSRFGLLLFIVPAVIFMRLYGRTGIRLVVYAMLLLLITFLSSDDLVKPLFKRMAPSHQPALLHRVLLTREGTGEQYSFISSRAAAAFAMALFVWLIADREERWLKILLAGYAVLMAYSRVYSGLHYPGDVAGSFVFGGLLALAAYYLYFVIDRVEYRRPA